MKPFALVYFACINFPRRLFRHWNKCKVEDAWTLRQCLKVPGICLKFFSLQTPSSIKKIQSTTLNNSSSRFVWCATTLAGRHTEAVAIKATAPHRISLSASTVIRGSHPGITFEKFAKEELITEIKMVGHLGNGQRWIAQ